MKVISIFILALIVVSSCVPMKKYNELAEREKLCSEALKKYKTNAIDFEARAISAEEQYQHAQSEADALKRDTSELGHRYRKLRAQYDQIVSINEALETTYDKLRLSGASETAALTANLEAKKIELQRKEDELNTLEKALSAKQTALEEREQRIHELEEIINRKDVVMTELKMKVAEALRGFENKGLSVEERNGKIYVSLEAKLLFASGSTSVQNEGKAALIDLATVLAPEKEMEIIVEGHTDSDKMNRSTYPKNNWELSVLRATSVIEIMTENSDLDPKQLMAAGRSEYHPVDATDKAKNRRIEIIISPNLNELYELISKD